MTQKNTPPVTKNDFQRAATHFCSGGYAAINAIADQSFALAKRMVAESQRTHAIEFAKWIGHNYEHYHGDEWMSIRGTATQTTEELYQIFKKENQNSTI